MKMEETNICTEHTSENLNEQVTKLREGIKRLKFQLAKVEDSRSSPAIEITFKNSDVANKYKTAIETFLYTLLTEEEKKTVSFTILEENIESPESPPPENLFCIDTASSSNEDDIPVPCAIPNYSTSQVLLPLGGKDDESFEVQQDESTPSIHVTTCYNCLGNHHMKECPERHDKRRVARNRKTLSGFLQTNNTRYHVDEEQKKNGGRPGQISTTLREALGLKPHQLPTFIYHMRILGYPPGWLQESVVESSGLNMYDSEGNVVSNKGNSENGENVQYDSDKFIEYPGFNCPAPKGVVDEWEMLRMPPLQPHQQLSEAVKLFTRPSPVESIRKRKKDNCNSETKRTKSGDSESSQNEDSRGGPETPLCSPSITDDSIDAFGDAFNKNSVQTPNGISRTQTPQSSGSLSSTPGTAIVDRGNPFTKLPDLAKFSKGITEHLPYENLPGATGTFENMRNVLNCVRQKLTFNDE